MYAKLLMMCWRLGLQPSTLLTGLGMPFAFSLISPSFQGPVLAGILILYLVFSFSATMDSQALLRFSLVQLPVNARQVVVGSFLFQLTVTLAAWLVAAGYVLATGLDVSLPGLARIALLSLFIGGITRALGFRLTGKGATLVNMLLFIPVLALSVTGQEMLAFSFLSPLLLLLLALGGFLLAMALSVRFPPLMKEVG